MSEDIVDRIDQALADNDARQLPPLADVVAEVGQLAEDVAGAAIELGGGLVGEMVEHPEYRTETGRPFRWFRIWGRR